jgi:hypothetical protein
MGPISIRLIKYGSKFIRTDFNNPITIDNTDFLITVGKGALKIAKEVLLP